MQPNHIISQPQNERENLAQQLRELMQQAHIADLMLTIIHLRTRIAEHDADSLASTLREAQQ